eukprot:scaffold7020_cov430-Prasinococcus_capsulatus_cf.AAC.5
MPGPGPTVACVSALASAGSSGLSVQELHSSRVTVLQALLAHKRLPVNDAAQARVKFWLPRKGFTGSKIPGTCPQVTRRCCREGHAGERAQGHSPGNCQKGWQHDVSCHCC